MKHRSGAKKQITNASTKRLMLARCYTRLLQLLYTHIDTAADVTEIICCGKPIHRRYASISTQLLPTFCCVAMRILLSQSLKLLRSVELTQTLYQCAFRQAQQNFHDHWKSYKILL